MTKLIKIACLSTLLIASYGFAKTNKVASCDVTNIKLGINVAALKKSCGTPTSEHNRSNKNYVKYKTTKGTVETETKFKFVDGKLVSISYEKEDEAKG